MKISKITIENYKSIENETFEISEIDGSYTYTLIGINEAGKSSILKAISIKDSLVSVLPQDFHDPSKPVIIKFYYSISDREKELITKKLTELSFPEELKKYVPKDFILNVQVDFDNPTGNRKFLELNTGSSVIKGYSLVDNVLTKVDDQELEFDIEDYLKTNLLNSIDELSHRIILWQSEARYLISEPINLEEFINDPIGKSVPLYNCFNLAGFDDITGTINKIRNNTSEVRNLQDKLEDEVGAHIKKVWPEHPIEIRFQIDNMHLSFLVEDAGVKYETKTTSQRSDGFRQFVSFLLTVSAQSSAGKLTNTLLLVDEPETHIHPKGQENLRDELIKITKDGANNICIFATHSNYMIDKKNLNRSFRMIKEANKKTKIFPIDGSMTTYSEVDWIVFDIPTNDYHNELYGFLEANKSAKLNLLPKEKDWINDKLGKTEKVSLAKYIRNSIHHPENRKNKEFTPDELKRSIRILHDLKYK